MNGLAWTAAAARRTSASAMSRLPRRMLSAIVPAEQVHVLQHEAEERAQLVERHLADVDAVDQDPAAGDVVEAQQQVDDRGLARARRADDAHPLARLHLERHVLEHVVLVVVGEPHVLEDDMASSAGARGSGFGVRGVLNDPPAIEKLRAPNPEPRTPAESSPPCPAA